MAVTRWRKLMFPMKANRCQNCFYLKILKQQCEPKPWMEQPWNNVRTASNTNCGGVSRRLICCLVYYKGKRWASQIEMFIFWWRVELLRVPCRSFSTAPVVLYHDEGSVYAACTTTLASSAWRGNIRLFGFSVQLPFLDITFLGKTSTKHLSHKYFYPEASTTHIHTAWEEMRTSTRCEVITIDFKWTHRCTRYSTNITNEMVGQLRII